MLHAHVNIYTNAHTHPLVYAWVWTHYVCLQCVQTYTYTSFKSKKKKKK